MSASSIRLVIFTSWSSPYSPLILQKVVERHGACIQAIVKVRVDRRRSAWKRFLSVVRRAGLRYALLKSLLLGSIRIKQALGLYPSICSLCRKYRVRRLVLGSLKAQETVEAVKRLEPDVVLSVLFEKIFPLEILQIPSQAALNLHPAPLPRYAGIAPTFWVLSRGERETGVTLHYMDEGIDTGEIYLQKRVEIGNRDSVHSLYVRCCTAGSDLLSEAIEMMLKDRWDRTPQQEGGTYFSAPTQDAYRLLRKHGHSLFSIADFLWPSP